MLVRLAYLGITNAFALLRLLPGCDRDKDAEILALRHQIAVLQRQLGGQKVRFRPADRALLAALLSWLPRPRLQELALLVRPDTVLRWHRDVIARRHAAVSRPPSRGRPRTVRSVRALALRLARSTRRSTTRTDHTRASPMLGPFSPCRNRSPIWTTSPGWTSADEIGSAASSTSTTMPLDLHGGDFRQAQGWRAGAGARSVRNSGPCSRPARCRGSSRAVLVSQPMRLR